jgi:hypothetical protein
MILLNSFRFRVAQRRLDLAAGQNFQQVRIQIGREVLASAPIRIIFGAFVLGEPQTNLSR